MSQRARAGVAVLVVLVQCALLYAPHAPAVDTGGLPMDKLVHMVMFAIPTVALVAAGVPRGWVIALMVVHAPLSEIVQQLVLPARSGDVRDLAADLVGVALGAFLTRGGRLAPVAPVPEPTRR